MDYYRIDTYGKATITITLDNIPDNCDYDLELYIFNNIAYCEEDDISLFASSRYAGTKKETISRNILPNVYYIRVYSYNDTFNANSLYSLSVNVNYNYKNESISELRYSQNVGAAMWVSVFDPFGITPFSLSTSREIGVVSSEATLPMCSIAHSYTSIIRSNDEILHASLFI